MQLCIGCQGTASGVGCVPDIRQDCAPERLVGFQSVTFICTYISRPPVGFAGDVQRAPQILYISLVCFLWWKFVALHLGNGMLCVV